MDENLIKAATENFSLPHDIVSLPSGGIFYKSKKKTVKVGYLTASDENIIVNSATNTQDNLILTIIRNKLYEHDLRPDELIEGDIQAILIFLRNTAFGPEYNVTLNDPKTGKNFTATLILDELNIKKTESTPNEEGYFITTLPVTKSQVKLKVLTYSELIELDKMADEYPTGRVVPRITWRLNKQIIEVDGNTDRANISRFIEQMPISDSKFIRNFLRENQPGLDLTKKVKTPSGELVTVEVAFGADFFRPFF